MVVLELDTSVPAWGWTQGGVTAEGDLDAGLLIGTANVVAGSEGLAVPKAPMQVQHHGHFRSTERVAGEIQYSH